MAVLHFGEENEHPIEGRLARNEVLGYVEGVVNAYVIRADEDLEALCLPEKLVDAAIREAYSELHQELWDGIRLQAFWTLANTIRRGLIESCQRRLPGSINHDGCVSTEGNGAGIAKEMAQPPLAVVAKNLEHCRILAGLSYRKLAALIGPGDGDHKAVSAHCRGIRAPEDRTIAEYAAAFSKKLKRQITPTEIRLMDLTLSAPMRIQ